MVKDFYTDLLRIQVRETGEAYIPFTVVYVFRKRKQYLDLMSLPEEKRPTEELFWVRPAEELEEWIEKVVNKSESGKAILEIDESEIM